MGLEPATYALQVRCSANWATPAFLYLSEQNKSYFATQTIYHLKHKVYVKLSLSYNELLFIFVLDSIRIFILKAGNRGRTCDLGITNPSLCQLSYTSIIYGLDVVPQSLSLTQPTKLYNVCNHRINLLNSAVPLLKNPLILPCVEPLMLINILITSYYSNCP